MLYLSCSLSTELQVQGRASEMRRELWNEEPSSPAQELLASFRQHTGRVLRIRRQTKACQLALAGAVRSFDDVHVMTSGMTVLWCSRRAEHVKFSLATDRVN